MNCRKFRDAVIFAVGISWATAGLQAELDGFSSLGKSRNPVVIFHDNQRGSEAAVRASLPVVYVPQGAPAAVVAATPLPALPTIIYPHLNTEPPSRWLANLGIWCISAAGLGGAIFLFVRNQQLEKNERRWRKRQSRWRFF